MNCQIQGFWTKITKNTEKHRNYGFWTRILGFRDAGIPDIRFLGSRIPGFWPPFWTILDPFLDTSESPRAKSAPKWALPETDPSGSPPPTSSLDPPGGYSPLARYYPKKGSFLDHFWSKIGQNPKNPRRETVGFFRSRRESSIVEETTVHFLIVISARARGKPPTPKSGQNRKNWSRPHKPINVMTNPVWLRNRTHQNHQNHRNRTVKSEPQNCSVSYQNTPKTPKITQNHRKWPFLTEKTTKNGQKWPILVTFGHFCSLLEQIFNVHG